MMVRGKLTGRHPIGLTWTDTWGEVISVSVYQGQVSFTLPGGESTEISPEVLRFLADLAETDRHGNQVPHTMSQCYWVDCPEHKCEYTMSHLRDTCGRPTCRES